MKNKIKAALIVLILLLGFILRMYRFDNPIGDWHAFRQSDTSAVSKVFKQNGINLLYPAYFDISNIQSGEDNPNGYRFVEFPLFNALQAGVSSIGILTLEEWGRMISIFSSLITTLLLYLLVKKHLDYLSAIFAAFFFAVLPFSVFYGRVILPDPSTAMSILAGIYFFDKWIESNSKAKIKNSNVSVKGHPFDKLRMTLSLSKGQMLFAAAVICTAASLLLKPFALFFTLPLLYLAFQKFGLGVFKKWQLYLFAVLSVLPLIFWRVWILQFPEGIPVSAWLFNEGNIRFTGAFFNWIFAERIGKLILGYFGLVLLFLGMFKRNEKSYGFFISFLISSLIYIVVVARGNVQHDYYQILILPTICIFLGRGASLLLSLPTLLMRNLYINMCVASGVLMLIIVFSFSFSWFFVRDYFNINNRGLITAGIIADQKLPKNARVIAANNGDTSFLYYINRKGWPSYQKSPEELKLIGATHIVIPNPTPNDFSGLGKTFKVFYSSPEVLILSL